MISGGTRISTRASRPVRVKLRRCRGPGRETKVVDAQEPPSISLPRRVHGDVDRARIGGGPSPRAAGALLPARAAAAPAAAPPDTQVLHACIVDARGDALQVAGREWHAAPSPRSTAARRRVARAREPGGRHRWGMPAGYFAQTRGCIQRIAFTSSSSMNRRHPCPRGRRDDRRNQFAVLVAMTISARQVVSVSLPPGGGPCQRAADPYSDLPARWRRIAGGRCCAETRRARALRAAWPAPSAAAGSVKGELGDLIDNCRHKKNLGCRRERGFSIGTLESFQNRACSSS